MSHESESKLEAQPQAENAEEEEIFYMDPIERIKLIGTISDCDTQTLLNAYIDILGIESLRPFLLTTFFKSIPMTSTLNRNKKKKANIVLPPPLPQKLLIHQQQQNKTKSTLSTTTNHTNHKNNKYNNDKNDKNDKKKNTNSKKRQNGKIKNGRNFASSNLNHNKLIHKLTKHKQNKQKQKVKHKNSPNLNSVQLLHSTNQPLPSRTTPAPAPNVHATIPHTQSNGAPVINGHYQLSSHNIMASPSRPVPLAPSIMMPIINGMNGHHENNGYHTQYNGHNGHNGHHSEKEDEKEEKRDEEEHISVIHDHSDHGDDGESEEKKEVNIVPAPIAKQEMYLNLKMPIKVEKLNKNKIEKYFNLTNYPQDLGIFDKELPDDIYMKIFSWLDFKTVLLSLKLVSRAWFNIASQPSSLGHFKCLLPIQHNMQWDLCQFVHKLEISWKEENNRYDRWSDYNKCLTQCCKNNMRDIKELVIKFHDFSFYSFNKHPLKRLFKQQNHLIKLELNAILHWKEHDISDCFNLMLQTDIIHTLKSFIIHNFVITPNKEELIELKQQQQQQQITNHNHINHNGHSHHNLGNTWNILDIQHDDDIVMMESAKVLGQLLLKCDNLTTFRWHSDHINNSNNYTSYGIYIAFIMIYFKSLKDGSYGNINDLQLPSFPLIYKNKETSLYHGIVNKFRLKKLYFRGDLSIIDWNSLGIISPDLSYLDLNPSRATNESFTNCFTSCGQSLQYLSINTTNLATSGWYQNDELTNFIIPYFRVKCLNKLQKININVKFLEEKALFSFLLKCKYAKSLKTLSITTQSLKATNGTLKNDDLRKYIGQFVGNQQFEFTLTIKSQFYSTKRILNVIRLSDAKGIDIDKTKWKKTKKFKIKENNENDIQQSLSMKLADIHNSGQPRFQ